MSSDYYYEELTTRDFTVDAKVNFYAEFYYSDKELNDIVMDYIEENPDNESEETLWEINEFWQNNGASDEMDPVFAHQIFVEFAKDWMTNRILTALEGKTGFLKIENIVFDYDDICQITDTDCVEYVIQTKISTLAHLEDLFIDLHSPDDPNHSLECFGYSFEESDCKRVLDVDLYYELNDERGEYLRVKDEAIDRGIRNCLKDALDYESDCNLTNTMVKNIKIEIADLSFKEHEKDWDDIWKRAYEEYKKEHKKMMRLANHSD